MPGIETSQGSVGGSRDMASSYGIPVTWRPDRAERAFAPLQASSVPQPSTQLRARLGQTAAFVPRDALGFMSRPT